LLKQGKCGFGKLTSAYKSCCAFDVLVKLFAFGITILVILTLTLGQGVTAVINVIAGALLSFFL
jgi:hypothetical protein